VVKVKVFSIMDLTMSQVSLAAVMSGFELSTSSLLLTSDWQFTFIIGNGRPQEAGFG